MSIGTFAAILGISLAFSSMILSWYVLMPRKRQGHH